MLRLKRDTARRAPSFQCSGANSAKHQSAILQFNLLTPGRAYTVSRLPNCRILTCQNLLASCWRSELHFAPHRLSLWNASFLEDDHAQDHQPAIPLRRSKEPDEGAPPCSVYSFRCKGLELTDRRRR